MKTLILTRNDFEKSHNYWSDYVGKEDLSDFDGNVEIIENLGCVKFKNIKVKGYLLAKAGSGIEAGEGIISFYSYIKAKLKISAKLTISAGLFSINGAQDIEAKEINGNIVFGNKKFSNYEPQKSPQTNDK
jgi:hypothetical protein